MALTMTGINKAREVLHDIVDCEIKLSYDAKLSDILTDMNNDPNFSKFITDTKFGRDYYEKWSNLVKLIDGDFYQASANLTNSTKDFLEHQVKLNGKLNGSISESNSGKLSGSNDGSVVRDAFYDDFDFSIK